MRNLFILTVCLFSMFQVCAFDMEKLLDVVEKVESNNRNVIGKHGEVGPYQISQCVIDDLNRIYKRNVYKLKDAEDKTTSRKICKAYVLYWVKRKNIPITYENCARIWNGGPDGFRKQSTIKYWEKIRRELYE